jgi:hypothetical protein
MKLTTITLARYTVSKNMHKKPKPPSLIIYFLIKKKKKVLVYPSNIAMLFLMLKYRTYSVVIRFKGMSSYYDHVYKIEELNYKEMW